MSKAYQFYYKLQLINLAPLLEKPVNFPLCQVASAAAYSALAGGLGIP